MKAIPALVVATLATIATTAWAGDPQIPDHQWMCTCTASCDSGEQAVTVDVCADEGNSAEAAANGANSCARELEGQCGSHGACRCECHDTGNGC
jgi:hypothetical protein